MATFRITMKDPDYAGNELSNVEGSAQSEVLAKFLEWNEYITVEFDTTRGTARVMPVSEL
jgi:hypothetical protein